MSTPHIPGKFVWFELNTRDVADAQRFYGEVIGWKSDTMTMPDGSEYALLLAGKQPQGGYRALDPKSPAVPPHFLGYLSVEDVDATEARVKRAGGQVLAPAFDAPGVGRISVVTDPQGAALALFKSTEGDPADDVTQAGQWHWCELWSTDVEASKQFYAEVFGYEVSAMEGNDAYFILSLDGQMRGGLMASPVPQAPSLWLPYVCVDDVDATVARARKQGGELAGPLMEKEGVGRHGVIRGADGAALGVIAPAR